VAQDDQLISGKILDNIAFFDPEMDRARIRWPVGMARIHADIARNADAVSTAYRRYGVSGGQEQRVLLARALYREPCILILGEGATNLDEENEGG
jgi:ATP-binding cassette subfamily B protein RaxB